MPADAQLQNQKALVQCIINSVKLAPWSLLESCSRARAIALISRTAMV